MHLPKWNPLCYYKTTALQFPNNLLAIFTFLWRHLNICKSNEIKETLSLKFLKKHIFCYLFYYFTFFFPGVNKRFIAFSPARENLGVKNESSVTKGILLMLYILQQCLGIEIRCCTFRYWISCDLSLSMERKVLGLDRMTTSQGRKRKRKQYHLFLTGISSCHFHS